MSHTCHGVVVSSDDPRCPACKLADEMAAKVNVERPTQAMHDYREKIVHQHRIIIDAGLKAADANGVLFGVAIGIALAAGASANDLCRVIRQLDWASRPIDPRIVAAIKNRESRTDRYGDDLVFQVEHDLMDPEYIDRWMPEHKEACDLFRVLSEDERERILREVLDEPVPGSGYPPE